MFIHPDLSACTHVFVRSNLVRKSTRTMYDTYDGPFKVLGRKNKTFLVQMPTKSVYLSIDRLKPTFISDEVHLNNNILENRLKSNSTENVKSYEERKAISARSTTLRVTAENRKSPYASIFNYIMK